MPSVVEAKIPEARQGPRPLSAHLLTAALTYASSNAALPLLKSGSLNWKAALDKWISKVAEVDTLELTTAVEYESRRRLAAFLKGVKAYRNHPYRRTLPEPVVATRDGSSRLFEFSASGADDGPAILVVPSLVNRAYVLDLAEGQSFMRWLSANGVDGFLVDWGRPDDAERGFDLTNYIADRLERFFNLVYERSRKPVFVLGYCMGGNFALALTQRDRIVPPESARVIADALPNCQLQEPNVGHIGLIAGSRAAAEVWSPVLAWIRTNDP